MVKGIAELHGGAARAESDGPGKGTEIVVTIPLADAAADRVRLADAAGDRSPVRW
jgi:signal transduction histidine kinase